MESQYIDPLGLGVGLFFSYPGGLHTEPIYEFFLNGVNVCSNMCMYIKKIVHKIFFQWRHYVLSSTTT